MMVATNLAMIPVKAEYRLVVAVYVGEWLEYMIKRGKGRR